MRANRGFAVKWSEMARWNPRSFVESAWHWPAEYIQSLSTALQRKQMEATPDDLKNAQLATLRFDGTMEPREASPASIKGKLYVAYPGEVAYSKIDVRNGAIGIVPNDLGVVVFTTEFPIYHIRPEVALPEYITLLFRTTFFRQTINGMVSGASGRKRVQPDELEALEIPLPPLAVQQAIVERWRAAQAAAEAIKQDAGAREEGIRDLLQRELGTAHAPTHPKKKAFSLRWEEIDRWGVDMCRMSRNKPAVPKYPTARIKDICRMGSGGTPSRKIAAYFDGGIPWVKTTEVRNEVISGTEEKITQAGLENSAAKLYPAGSLVVAMYGQGATRGRTAKLGIEAATNQACCVLYDIDSCLETNYLWFYLMGEYDRLRELASGNNQPNLNAEMIANYEVPLPPLETQQALVSAITAARRSAATLRAEAERLRRQAAAEVEAAILGEARP